MEIVLDIIFNALFGVVVPFLFVIMVVVFFHELGHFWVARRCGVRVETFSIGFGQTLYSWMDSKGTSWKICLWPLGGYVKFYGDEDAASSPDNKKLKELTEDDQKDIFHFKPLWQRSAVVAAGPIANFILAIVIYACLFTFVGKQISLPIVDTIRENSAAERAGFIPGDLILFIDGSPVESFNDVARTVSVNPDRDLVFVVERSGMEVELVARPELVEDVDNFGNRYRLGRLGITSRPDQTRVSKVYYDPITAIGKGVSETTFIITQTFRSLGGIISGRESADALGGPVKIAQISGQMASLGWVAVFNWIALISVSIGLINLFPIPMLDGGHLLFYSYEAVIGKPMPEKVQEYGMRAGLAFVILLFVFVTWNDVSKISLFN